jgi:hypothetical protein
MKPVRRAGLSCSPLIFISATTSGEEGKGFGAVLRFTHVHKKIISGAFNNIPDHV